MPQIRNLSPIWQNDNDVSECFLCQITFNFFNRRHHCRKCGRVVCGDCSNNKIHYLDNTPIVLNPEDSSHNHRHHNRTQYSNSNELYRTCDECTREIDMIRRVIYNDPNPDIINEQNNDNNNDSNQIKHNNSSGEITRQLPCSSSTTSLTRRQNNNNNDNSSDTNLCPICAINLLKSYIEINKTIDQISNEEFEKFKELHINECLNLFNFNTDNSNRFSPDSNPKNKMLVYNVPPIPKPTYETIDETIDSTIDSNNSTLKINEDEEDLKLIEKFDECVICLEDLKPGDKVGRLECLCVFHYKCIKDWFNKKGYGECPVHFLHK
ncbi:uncharacterized protein KGF55_005435 [Candida pseudojiufengensis]|uniref:uncharacterized protein n=1 Tax=Candida pseudojiufengensis TaxID=497109 RepID=UPI002224A331|nr:uncharacterized protein KGF55_005435 [Candida pseudojiufengensis]KAI5959285.1 hypothetical protein KGF55_005435 [Candida pseudojiufengensis]